MAAQNEAKSAAERICALEHGAERARQEAEARMLEEERRHALEKSEGVEVQHELKTRIVHIESALEALASGSPLTHPRQDSTMDVCDELLCKFCLAVLAMACSNPNLNADTLE